MTDRRRRVRVLIVDDSPTRRSALGAMLEVDGSGIEVVGTASDPASALRAVQLDAPDVVTMDMEMPDGGGVVAIEQIMAERPVPILVVSSHVRGPRSILAIDALAAGALDVFAWPDRWDSAAAAALRERIRTLEGVTVLHHPRGARHRAVVPSATPAVVGVAASTGGPPALARLLSDLRGLTAPILVVQHLHADFMDAFVAWMTRSAAVPVVLAVDGSEARAGVVHVAPAGRHLTIAGPPTGGGPGILRLTAHPARLHVPSADVLFESMAATCGRAAVGVILTGMGEDGAEGLRAVRAAGGFTVGQDEATSVVWGMPRAASRKGALTRLAPLDGIGALVRARCSDEARQR